MTENVLAEAFHPGEFLREELEERGWTQVEFAEIIDRSPAVVNEIIMGKRGITPETAKALAASLGTSAELWMNLESIYQLNKTGEVSPKIAQQARLRSVYPIREMLRRMWIQSSENVQVLEARVLRYFEIDSLDQTPALASAAKKSGDSENLSPIQYAWLYRVKHIAENMSAPKYSSASLRKALEQLKSYLVAPEEVRFVPQILEKCGVRLVIVEPLQGSKIDGICFWLNPDSPVIGLSLRLDRIDNFWYVLRHEIEHVLNGDGMKNPVAEVEIDTIDQEKLKEMSPAEKKAHAAAAEFCTPQKALDDFLARVGSLPPRQRVLLFAKKLEIDPGIVVGQIQRKLDRFDLFRPMLVPIRHLIAPVAMTDGYGYLVPFEG